MRIIFMGSPASAVYPLQTLLEEAEKSASSGIEVVAVVSQPAARVGRGRNKQLQDPPVAAHAREQGLRVLQPVKAKDKEFLDACRELKPDVIVTCAYGQILTQEFLDIPARATINIHPSALPAYRGATPVPAALLAGEKITAVSILFTVKALDAGAIIVQKSFAIEEGETAGILTERLFRLSGPLLLQALEKLRDPSFEGTPQDPALVTGCGKIMKEMGEIDWKLTSGEIYNRFRAFHPWPGSWCQIAGKRVTVVSMSQAGNPPKDALNHTGAVTLSGDGMALAVRTGDAVLYLTRVKPAGGKEMEPRAFWNGYCQNKPAQK